MRVNRVKRQIKEGRAVLGTLFTIPSPQVVELAAHMGFDFVMPDAEHGPLNEMVCENMVRAADAAGICTVVRVPRNDRATIGRFLETGAQGVMVPWVNTAAEAQAAVAAVRYHPEGVRGLGLGRAADYGLSANLGDYARKANEETLAVIQIEDIAALPHLDAILAVPGIDVVFIGPADLAKSMGRAGRGNDPQVLETVVLIARRTLAAGVPLGVIVADPTGARQQIAFGARFVICVLENLMVAVGRAFVDEVRSGVG